MARTAPLVSMTTTAPSVTRYSLPNWRRWNSTDSSAAFWMLTSKVVCATSECMAGLGGDALDLVEGPVEEIVRALLVAAVDDVGRMQPCRQHLALGHEAGSDQIGQHDVGARARRRQVDVRRVFGRRLEQAGQHRRLGQVEVLDALAEIEIGRRLDAEGAAAHIGAVEIELQDFLLRQVASPSQSDRKASLILRSKVRSLDRNRFLASCWVMLEPPWTTELARTFSDMARDRPRKSMP